MSQQSDQSSQEKSAKYFIDNLNLIKLPFGMYLGDIYTAEEVIQTANGERKTSSGVYCLYESAVKIDFHTLASDEILVMVYGCSLDIIIINQDGTLTKELLGYDILNGEKPQYVAKRDTLFAVANNQTNNQAFSLITAFSNPGFDLADSSFPKRADLISKYPQHKELIETYTSE